MGVTHSRQQPSRKWDSSPKSHEEFWPCPYSAGKKCSFSRFSWTWHRIANKFKVFRCSKCRFSHMEPNWPPVPWVNGLWYAIYEAPFRWHFGLLWVLGIRSEKHGYFGIMKHVRKKHIFIVCFTNFFLGELWSAMHFAHPKNELNSFALVISAVLSRNSHWAKQSCERALL